MMPLSTHQHLKEVVYTLRETFDLTHEDIAFLMGVDPSWYWRLLQENRSLCIVRAVIFKHRIIEFMRERKEDSR